MNDSSVGHTFDYVNLKGRNMIDVCVKKMGTALLSEGPIVRRSNGPRALWPEGPMVQGSR